MKKQPAHGLRRAKRAILGQRLTCAGEIFGAPPREKALRRGLERKLA
jgi:hypothetical protein